MDEGTYLAFWGTRKAMVVGTTLAVLISWEHNRSILWAIAHGVLSWLYVLYWAVTS